MRLQSAFRAHSEWRPRCCPSYTHCAWLVNDGLVADPSGQSFLFSLTNKGDQPLRFSLKDKDRAVYVARCSVMFGKERNWSSGFCNLCLFHGRAANADTGNYVFGLDNPMSTYQADGGVAVAEDFVAGGVYIAATEIEVFQI